jgi:hypothetical protein
VSAAPRVDVLRGVGDWSEVEEREN